MLSAASICVIYSTTLKQFDHINTFSLCCYSLARLASCPGSSKACDFKNTSMLGNAVIERTASEK